MISAGQLLARRDGRLRVGERGELVIIMMVMMIVVIMMVMLVMKIVLMTMIMMMVMERMVIINMSYTVIILLVQGSFLRYCNFAID